MKFFVLLSYFFISHAFSQSEVIFDIKKITKSLEDAKKECAEGQQMVSLSDFFEPEKSFEIAETLVFLFGNQSRMTKQGEKLAEILLNNFDSETGYMWTSSPVPGSDLYYIFEIYRYRGKISFSIFTSSQDSNSGNLAVCKFL